MFQGSPFCMLAFSVFFSAETGFVVWVLDACEISGAGLVKNSALFCQLFIIMDHGKKCVLQTHNQGFSLSGDLETPDSVIVSLQLAKQHTSQG